MTTTIVKNLIIRGRHFTIVKNGDGFYLAIEDKYITDGKINQTLNGMQMHASKELNQCIEDTKNSVEIDWLVSQGHSMAEAFAIHFNMLDQLDSIKKAFA